MMENTGLAQALQESFSTVGLGITFESASLEWSVSNPGQRELPTQQDDDDHWITPILMSSTFIIAFVCTCLALIALILIAIYVFRRFARRAKSNDLRLKQDIEAEVVGHVVEPKSEKVEWDEGNWNEWDEWAEWDDGFAKPAG